MSSRYHFPGSTPGGTGRGMTVRGGYRGQATVRVFFNNPVASDQKGVLHNSPLESPSILMPEKFI